MQGKSFVTRMPDKAGAFLRASEIIAKHQGNILRASYNRAVDPYTLFIDVSAEEEKLRKIEYELLKIGYLNDKIIETRVIEVSIKIPDKAGALLPVLEILGRRNINISYLNSSSNGGEYQDFKMGLLIEDSAIIKILLDEISEIYQIGVINCDSEEENLDNTVFYIKLANEMQKLFGLDTEKTMQFVAESNRILQALQSEGEDAGKVFRYIRRFAHFVSANRRENFKLNIVKKDIGAGAIIWLFQPPCGSNCYVIEAERELVLLDTGFAIYGEEMLNEFKNIWPDFSERMKRVFVTHADVDHCGLLSKLENAEIIINRKSAESLSRQLSGGRDFREGTELGLGYSRISQIISGYTPPNPERFTIIDTGTPEEHEELLTIGKMNVGKLTFDILESSGGHLNGEMVYVCKEQGVIFTGDLLINIEGFSAETAEFNSFAPYLMKSVNVDSKRASEMRKEIAKLAKVISAENQKPCIICCGHGPLSEFIDGKLSAIK